jgi:hypothetical protein
MLQMREKIGSLETDLPNLGDTAKGPGLEAIGRGYLALGEAVHGLQSLEAAWDSGYRSTELALALVRAHAGAFEEEHPGWAQQGIQKDALARRQFHAQRAHVFALETGPGGLAAHPYEASILAFLDDDSDRAVNLAKQAVSRDALALEPRVHLVRVLTRKAHLNFSKGRREAALALFKEVAVAARDSEGVGRSMDAAYAVDLSWRLTLLPYGLHPRPDWVGNDDALEALCDVRLRLDARNANALSDKLTLRYGRAERALSVGADPLDDLHGALVLQKEAEAWAPKSSNIRADGMIIHLFLAQRAYLRGEPAEPHLQLALDRADALDSRPRDARPKLRLIQARFLLRDGKDPVPALQLGLALAEERFKSTGEPAFLFDAGRLELEWHRFNPGETSHLERAEKAFQILREQDPQDPWHWNLSGWAALERAKLGLATGSDSLLQFETAWGNGQRAWALDPDSASHALLLAQIATEAVVTARQHNLPLDEWPARARKWVGAAHRLAPGWIRPLQMAKRSHDSP